MPEVNGRHFAYTSAGYKAAARARKRKPSKRNYSDGAIMMAKRGMA